MQNIEDLYELSPMQQGMLFHTLYAPESEVYFEQLLCILEGELNIGAFQKAWEQVVARHAVLRSSFYWEEIEKPLQMVSKQVDLPWEKLDWRNLTADEQQKHLEDYLSSDRQKGFDLSLAPLMRFAIIQLTDQTYQFIWSHHHILFDGWSMQIVLKEVLDFYEANQRGEYLRLPPVRPYREYIEWLQQQDIEQAKKFWQQTLQGFEVPTLLAGSKEVGIYHEQHFQLSQTVTEKLQSAARQNQLTLNNLVQATWALLLSRYSQESDVAFGATVSGRPPEIAGVESMVGLFINTLPVRVQLAPHTQLLDLLKHLQVQLVESQQFSYSSLAEIQGLSDVPKGTSLFDSIVVFENYPVDSSVSAQPRTLSWSNIRGVEQTNYPLTVVIIPEQELLVKVSYDANRFDDDSISRMLGHFVTLLSGIVANPQQQICQLPLLTAAEQQQLLVEWNDTAVDYPQDKCLHQLFEEQVERTPDALAVVYENQQLTYSELNSRANQLAHYLQSLGVGADVLVGICVERSLEMVVGMLGVLKAGGAYVPLDPEYPQERLSFMLKDSQVSVLLTQQHLVARLQQHPENLVCLDEVWSQIRLNSQDNPQSGVNAGNLANLIYTSGSTGRPKGVMVEHRGLYNLAIAQIQTFGLDCSSRVLQFASFSFDASLSEIMMACGSGATLYLGNKDSLMPGLPLMERLRTDGITHITLPPSALAVLPLESLPRLQTVIVAGEPCSMELMRRWSDGRNFFNAYGPTEASVCATIAKCTDDDAKISIGRPIANTQIYILDQNLQPVPVGVPGELHIGGVGLARGYLNRPELTQEKFIPNPFDTAANSRLYKTGDLARYLPSGDIEYLGRIDNQVKIRGFRIELGEIEAILNQHPEIIQAVVIAREDEPGKKILVAYLVAQDNSLTSSSLRNLLKQKLPDYMIPAAFVFLETLPLTPNGKINRRALPAPDTAQRNLEVEFVAPRTPTEQELATIWAEVLKVKQVGMHDNFFELGGHSLLATQVVSRLREAFSVEFSLRYLFENPTIAELAQKMIEQQIEQAENDALAEILGEVDGLSEAEVTQQLLC